MIILYTYMGKSYSLQASGEVGQLLLQPQHVPLRAAFDEGCRVAGKVSHRHRDRGHGRRSFWCCFLTKKSNICVTK